MPTPAADLPAFHPVYVRLLLALLRQRGEDADALQRAAGISDAELRGSELLMLAPVRTLIASAIRLTGSPWLGLDLGALAPLHTHGAVGFATQAASTLGEAVQTLVRFIPLRTRAVRLLLERGAMVSRLRVLELVDLGESRDFVLDALLIIQERLLETLGGSRLQAAHYALPWPRPAWAAHYTQLLAGQISFDAPELTLSLPNRMLDARCLTADPEAYALAARECEQRLSAARPGREIAGRIRKQWLLQPGSYPSAAAMAGLLHMSTRTLFRQLQRAGLSYQSLIDEARCEHAQRLLARHELSVEQIADQLGFADTSNFSRTFRRWCGLTPRAWRLNARSPGDQAGHLGD